MQNNTDIKVLAKKVIDVLQLIEQNNADITNGRSKNDEDLIKQSVSEKKQHTLELINLLSSLDIETELNESELLNIEKLY